VKVPGLPAAVGLPELREALASLEKEIGTRDGFYFLPGRDALVDTRQEKYKISLQRFRKCRRVLGFLRYFPYLRSVAVSGSQAILNSNPSSDIDLFFIVKKNRIWLARALASFYFQILGQRRHGRYIADRFCLNHYVREGILLSSDRNLYTAVIYTNLLPVLGHEELAQFWRNNSWIGDFLHSPRTPERVPFFNFHFSPLQRFFEVILDLTVGWPLNYIAAVYQKRRIRLEEHIIVSDEELSFHPGSRGQKVLKKFEQNSGNPRLGAA